MFGTSILTTVITGIPLYGVEVWFDGQFTVYFYEIYHFLMLLEIMIFLLHSPSSYRLLVGPTLMTQWIYNMG